VLLRNFGLTPNYMVLLQSSTAVRSYNYEKLQIKLVRYEAFTAGAVNSVFWDITLYSPLKVNVRLTLIFALVSCSVYSSTLDMEAIYSSEKSVEFQRSIQRYTPEDKILPNFNYPQKREFWACNKRRSSTRNKNDK
jgi:hypothetical protein